MQDAENLCSTSLISGLALMLFALLSVSLLVFNYSLFVPFSWILLGVGIPILAVGTVIVSVNPNVDLLAQRQLAPLLLLVTSGSLLVSGFVLTVFLMLITSVVPLLVLLAQGIACATLIRSRVSKRCKLLLIASVALAIATWPVVQAIGSAKDPDPMDILRSPVLQSWLAFTIAATVDTGKGNIDGNVESGSQQNSSRKTATFLWVLGAMVWLVLLIFIEGAIELDMS